jgi:hypothetical protein
MKLVKVVQAVAVVLVAEFPICTSRAMDAQSSSANATVFIQRRLRRQEQAREQQQRQGQVQEQQRRAGTHLDERPPVSVHRDELDLGDCLDLRHIGSRHGAP